MKRVLATLAVLLTFSALLATTGCSSTGSREYRPGKGWVPN
jgi:hypothetical protein